MAGLLGIASPYAMANDSGWYIGGNVGQSRSTIDDARITNSLLGAGFTTTGIRHNEHDLGYKLFAGYQFGKYFALEGGYFDLGKFDFTATTTPTGTLHGSIKLKGLYADFLGILPFTSKFSAFARIGVDYAQADDSYTGTGAVNVLDSNPSTRQANYNYGVGLQYNFVPSFGMRLEAERYRVNDAVGHKGDVDLYSLGLVYRFGRHTAPAAPPPEPEPEAAPEAAPEPAPLIDVNFSAQALFGFDKSSLRDAGKQELDAFAAKLKGVKFSTIEVIGYTDRIGSPEYNMKLSQRRAEVVKDYLVESAGIPADKIVAEGEYGSNPVTKPGECKGTKVTAKLIACLAPDRRVEVKVFGQK
ncbi:MAG: OmpA family protein [Gammaproteobacteria bacterium]